MKGAISHFMRAKQDVESGYIYFCKKSHFVIVESSKDNSSDFVHIELGDLCIVADVERFDDSLKLIIVVNYRIIPCFFPYFFEKFCPGFNALWEVLE